MNSVRHGFQLATLTLVIVTGWMTNSAGQGTKMNVGQAGVNPGAGLFVIAE